MKSHYLYPMLAKSDKKRVDFYMGNTNVDDVIEATEQAGISKKVVRFTPIGNVKG